MQLISCKLWGRGRLLCRGERLLSILPLSRGLCLKVTLGGQIDGISEGANGLHGSTRRTRPQQQLQVISEQGLVSAAIHHLLNALSVDGLAQINGSV